MGYRSNIVLDLSEDFGEGCSVTIRDPRCVLRVTDLTAPDMDGLSERQKADVLTKGIHSTLERLIVAWNVWDIETGESLPIPKVDPDVLNPNRCPEMLVMVLSRKVTELMAPFARKHLQGQGQTPPDVSSETTESSAEPSSNSGVPQPVAK